MYDGCSLGKFTEYTLKTDLLTRGTLCSYWYLKTITEMSKLYESACTSSLTLCDDHEDVTVETK